ncbi:hypothetical protein ASG67_07770 [Sphingomonas sp. Leaf339]|uniref:hypothetical protein n=1 Tax=Sphingomonas sp. Leaf339 TaxID=1736343 RepID=UPI0006F71CFE|nr:hypothetical protein [Sphingomonas sp. Leaf339]KQU55972.1 hypothetical protein ASG67_07770 [Sphingomonas sp. Leaf339]
MTRLITTATALLLVSLAIFWPGFAEYDSVAQYAQALSGSYDDWHPPVMARLWAGLLVFGAGAGPMLVVQMATYWSGLGLIAAAIMRAGRARAGWAIVAVGLFPLFLGWQAVVLKDAQGIGAMLAAVGIVGWWRIDGRRVPGAVWAVAAMLLGYAVLIRANGVFAAAPLVAMLVLARSWRTRGGIVIGLVAVTLALSPGINQRVLGAEPSGVQRTQPLYDLAGIAVRIAPTDAAGFTQAETLALIAHHCVTAFFWDSLGEAPACAAASERMQKLPPPRLYAMLVPAIVAHPLAYAGHRLAHLNSTLRWWVPAEWPNAGPPGGSEPNELGLGQPGWLAVKWQRLAGLITATPLGWPVAWIIAAITALVATWRAASPVAGVARAMLVSALMLEASFGAFSIASDLRYHLWAMIVTALACVLLGGERWSRRAVIAGSVALALVVAIGLVARATLPVMTIAMMV